VSKTIVELTISLDGFATGESVDVEHPFGHSGQQLHAWHQSTDPVDTRAAAGMMHGTGAFILGRTTFDVGIGTWGEDGAFGTECFVLTSCPHQAVHRGSTTFTFITDGIDAAASHARGAAGDQAVVVMGGPNTAQQAIAAGIVDELRLHVRPILLGSGIRLLDCLPSPGLTLDSPEVTSSAAAIHVTLKVDVHLAALSSALASATSPR
jgi:dihydrofolate reductase